MDHVARYPLSPAGSVRNWLACGTIASPLTTLDRYVPAEGPPFGTGGRWILNFWAWHPESQALKKRIYQGLPARSWQTGSPPVLNRSAFGEQPWTYRTAEEDSVIDFSRFNLTPAVMEAWIYAGLESPRDLSARAELLTIGPAELRLNDQPEFSYAEKFSYVEAQRIPVELRIRAGWNDLFIYGLMLGWREARLALGLRFTEPCPVTVGIPLGEVDPERWSRAENNLNRLQVRQFAFPAMPAYLHSQGGEPFEVEAQVTLSVPDLPWASLEDLELPVGDSVLRSADSEPLRLPVTPEVAAAMAALPGENSLRLTLRPVDGTPFRLDREIWASRNTFSGTPYGEYDSRRREALEHLARMPRDVPAAMAAVRTGRASRIDPGAVSIALGFLTRRCDCADFYALGLLALLYRYGDSPALAPEDRTRIEATLVAFKFWIDEPGLDGMCYFTENHQILFHVAAYLAGQRYPDRVFTNSGLTGSETQIRAKERALSWIRKRLRGNFSEWDSNAYLAMDVFALLSLAEFGQDGHLCRLAATLLDKIFFLIACQSFRGVHGCTHGRCYVQGLKSARFENTSSLERIAWGMGIFNGETRAAGLLAMAEKYRVHPVIQQIGADVDAPLLTLARSKAAYAPEGDMHAGEWDVRTCTYRSAEVMLSAAIDYRKGEMGIQEHLWQATLGPEAVVFTTYPGNSQEHGNARPNFWAGSARLPRVAMFNRTVICLYRFEPGAGLGFSHAYFPAAAFDEYRIEDNWAFGRADDGYVALWGDGALALTESGRHAGQELRSHGAGEAWICRVGCAAEDGAFTDFCGAVKSRRPVVRRRSGPSAAPEAPGVEWATPREERLLFAWEGPLLVDGVAQDWDCFPHYSNAYTDTPLDADIMTIRYSGQVLTLDLSGRS